MFHGFHLSFITFASILAMKAARYKQSLYLFDLNAERNDNISSVVSIKLKASYFSSVCEGLASRRHLRATHSLPPMLIRL